MKTTKNPKTHEKPKTGSSLAPSLSSAASQLGHPPALLKRAKKLGAPGFRLNGNVDLSVAGPWIKANMSRLTAKTETEELELRKLRAQCAKLEHELETARAQYIHREVYQADAERVLGLAREAFLSFHKAQLSWEGFPAVERDKRGKDEIRRCMTNLKTALTKTRR